MKKSLSKEQEEKLLTEVELELMTLLWKVGEGSVNDVLTQLPPERALAYTSVSTILRILEQKKVVKARKEGRGHIYIPTISKAEYESKALKNVVDRVFEGAPVALVRQLVDTVKLNADDLEEIKKIIQKAGVRR